MRRLVPAILLLLLCSVDARGQNSTTVTSTVVDAGGVTWINGTYTFTFVGEAVVNWPGGSFNRTVTGVLDNTGTFFQSLPSNATITPSPTFWNLKVCPSPQVTVSPSGCFIQNNLTIQGPAQTLTVTPPAIAITPVNGFPPQVVYADAEIVNPPDGFTYLNITNNPPVERLWNGSAWVNVGGGSGGGGVSGMGTAGDIPVFTAAQVIGNSSWTDNLNSSTYTGPGGIGTQSVALTGIPPFTGSLVEGPSANCLAIADGKDALCSIADLSPAGLWYSANGAPYVPLAPQGSSNGPIFNDQLISGGGVTWTGLLNFTVSAASYAIVSTNYTSPQTNVTLAAADPTNPRIDSIIVDNTGTVSVLTGTPAGSPAAPVPNPTSQLQLTTVTVAANATTPTLNSILVYDENVGTPTEWNCTPTANFNCNSTSNPFHLTHDIEATTATATNNAVLAFSSTVNLSTYSTISFNIRNKATWPAAKSVSICFLNSATVVGQCIGFKNGIFGFNQANVSSYQQIVIPLSAFALTGVVDRVRFQVAGGGGTIGFYLDWIQIQSALTGNGGGGNFQLQVDGTATALTANLQDSGTVTFSQTTTNGLTIISATAASAGAVAFNNITSGANTTATMTCGIGCSLSSVPQFNIGAVGTNGVLGLKGTTSGTATFTAPGVAGTTTNPVVSSNALNLPSGNGCSTLGLSFGGGGYGFSVSGTGIDFICQNNTVIEEFPSSTKGTILGSDGVAQWGTTALESGNTVDTGISRGAAGEVDFGTGAQGNKGGSIKATNGTFSGLTSGDCVQASTAGLLTTTALPCGTPSAGTISHGLVFPIGDPTNVTALTTSSVSFYVTVPFGCTINAYNLAIDAGTITVKFWKVATGTAIPTSGNSINTSGVSISSGTAIHSTTVTDFTTTNVAANDIMAMAVTAVSGAHQVTGVLSCAQ